MAEPLLSVCMIVKDEEPVLGRALASVAGLGAQLVVVDTGSSDRTVAIAEAAGAEVHTFAWVGDFSAARNFAFSKARGTWMLVLDADEEVTPAFRANVERVLRESRAAALEVPVTCVDDRGGVQMVLQSARLLRKERGYAYEGRVHETFVASVLRSGGEIRPCEELGLLHHGYTTEEAARKNRLVRNRELLEASHRAEPEAPRYWHYLGQSLVTEGDYAAAKVHLGRMLAKAPDHELAAWSASLLGSIHEAERQFGLAWDTWHRGAKMGNAGRVHCLAKLGALALREGDPATARACADAIERAPADGLSSRSESRERAEELRAGAREPGAEKTQAELVAASKRHPGNLALADLCVKSFEASLGPAKGPFEALRACGATPIVAAAAMHAFFRAGAYAQCVELGERTGVRSELYPFALAKVGRAADGSKELADLGERAAAHRIVFGLAYGDEAAFERGVAASSPAHREALARLGGESERVPAHLAWAVTEWLACAVAVHEPGVAGRLEELLGEEGLRALLTYDAASPMSALELALAHPNAPGSQEVLGLVAHAHGDFAGAAAMLGPRARAGDAAVRVYVKAADAFTKLGQPEAAAEMRALGRAARPHAKAF